MSTHLHQQDCLFVG